jgi:hypothetical protein
VIAIGLLEDNSSVITPFGLTGISSKGSSSSSPGRWYFSTLRRRKGLNGGAKRGLRTGWVGEGDKDEDAVSDSTSMLGIVSSKSNSSSTVRYCNVSKYRQQRWLHPSLTWMEFQVRPILLQLNPHLHPSGLHRADLGT